MADSEGTEPEPTVEPDEALRYHAPVPDDGVPMAVVEIVDYIDGDGDNAYCFRIQGTESTSAILGLLELAKHQLLRDSTFPGDDD